MTDVPALTKAFSDARAAYLMLPPAKSREEQERDSDGIAKAAKESGLLVTQPDRSGWGRRLTPQPAMWGMKIQARILKFPTEP